MPLPRPLAVALIAALVAGCSSGDAFVDRLYMTKTIKKQKLPGWDGSVVVCYGSDAPRETRDQLASEACAVYGLKALLSREYHWQCRFTVPHRADYQCYDPDMRLANGRLINPFDGSQVQAWKREQRRIKDGLPAEDPKEVAVPQP